MKFDRPATETENRTVMCMGCGETINASDMLFVNDEELILPGAAVAQITRTYHCSAGCYPPKVDAGTADPSTVSTVPEGDDIPTTRHHLGDGDRISTMIPVRDAFDRVGVYTILEERQLDPETVVTVNIQDSKSGFSPGDPRATVVSKSLPADFLHDGGMTWFQMAEHSAFDWPVVIISVDGGPVTVKTTPDWEKMGDPNDG